MGGVNPIAYLRGLLGFAFSRNPLLWFGLLLSAGGVVFELAAMTILFPLSEAAIGRAPAANSWVTRALRAAFGEANLKSLLIVFLALLGTRILVQLAGQCVTSLLGKRLHAQLSSTAFSRIIEQVSLRSIEERSVGYYITLAGDESFRASNIVIAMNQFVSVALLGALYFASIFLYSPVTGIAVAVFLAVSAALMLGSIRRTHRLGERQVLQSQSAGTLFLDALNGLRTVRALAAQAYVAARYRDEVFRYARTLFAVDLVSLMSRAVPALLLVAMGAIFLAQRDLSPQSGFDAAYAFALLAFLLRLFPVVGQAATLLMRIVADARAGHDVVEAIRNVSEGSGGNRTLRIPVRHIQFERVSFEYLAGKPVLHNVSLVFEKGSSYAISGPSGSGKSTLMDLLLRFHEATGGRILVDGVPVQEYEVSSLRRGILLLGQQTTIFNDTVRNNIAFGVEATNAEIETACRLALIHDVISALPQGYDTALSYQGTNLSGGQRQRIGIARALLRQPDVLILDESTSALDEATRTAVLDGLLRAFRDRMVIFVTHDPVVSSRVRRVFELRGQQAAQELRV